MTWGMYAGKDIRKDGLLKMRKMKERDTDKPLPWRKISTAPMDGTKVEVKREKGAATIAWFDGKEWLCKELLDGLVRFGACVSSASLLLRCLIYCPHGA